MQDMLTCNLLTDSASVSTQCLVRLAGRDDIKREKMAKRIDRRANLGMIPHALLGAIGTRLAYPITASGYRRTQPKFKNTTRRRRWGCFG
jgi:hypothetical protein